MIDLFRFLPALGWYPSYLISLSLSIMEERATRNCLLNVFLNSLWVFLVPNSEPLISFKRDDVNILPEFRSEISQWGQWYFSAWQGNIYSLWATLKSLSSPHNIIMIRCLESRYSSKISLLLLKRRLFPLILKLRNADFSQTYEDMHEFLRTKLAFKLICLSIIIVTCYCTITVVLKHSKRTVKMTKGQFNSGQEFLINITRVAVVNLFNILHLNCSFACKIMTLRSFID